MFRNYQHRGEVFREAARALAAAFAPAQSDPIVDPLCRAALEAKPSGAVVNHSTSRINC